MAGFMADAAQAAVWAAMHAAELGTDPGAFYLMGHSAGAHMAALLTLDRQARVSTRVVAGGPSYPYNVAVARGPQFLALESTLNRGVVDLQAAGPRTSQLKLTDVAGELPATWAGKQAYRMEGLVAGKPKELVLVPFADARTYRVWLLRP